MKARPAWTSNGIVNLHLHRLGRSGGVGRGVDRK
jgi:hypothetical protein